MNANAARSADAPSAGWKDKCAAIIPCFNEAAHIQQVVADVRRLLPRVIVVDDGSTDATTERAKLAGAEALWLEKNFGKGAALRAGWQHAGELGFEWVLMLDGDGQHSAEDVPGFLACAETTGAKLVVGNRMGNARKIPPLRRFVNRWMSRRLSRLTGATLPDSQCGFRLARLETLRRLRVQANRFEIESDMLVAFLAAGHTVRFVPVQTIYRSRATKIHPLADTLRWFRWWRRQRKRGTGGILLAPAAPANL
ncbi:MAG: glycosyltransferase family 2 protein [Verrucomicrobiota bacterium]|nr:glycosyltransferase family 2 protein [Verrucomicrobiota bacterium]